MMQKQLLIMLLFLVLAACHSKQQPEQKKEPRATETTNDTGILWSTTLPSLVTITSYDGNRILETGQGFFVDSQYVVTRLSLLSKATRAMVNPYDGNESFEVTSFAALDRIANLVLIHTNGFKRAPLPLLAGTIPNLAKTYFIVKPESKTLVVRTGKVLSFSTVNGMPIYQISNQILKSSFGAPIFVSNKQIIGIAFSEVVDYKQKNLVVPAQMIFDLVAKKSPELNPFTETISQNDKAVSEANSRIRGVLLETEMGNITLRLFNETPDYRDNFIKLAREGYFDGLMFHRVIPGFGIQSGASDTRYAGKDDVVGWKGPGYTLPAHIVPGKLHRRGMVGSPRKPDTDNTRRRSDGSQFYIVSGRLYNDKELNDIEKENDYKFPAAHRQIYKTVGGAPHIDGSYTIFGEVISGMDVVDRINQVEIGQEFRPVKDIRLKKVKILK